MFKKFLYFILFILIFAQATFAQEVFRVTSVNFDTSNSLIFLTSPDNTTEAIMKRVKLTKLQNPKRVYFDIDSAVLTAPAQNWYFNSGGVKQIKVSQFSTNPNKIRVLLYLNESFDWSKIKFLKVNNNIVIQFKNTVCKNEYFQNTYRDEKSSAADFYENLSISSQDLEKVKTAVNSLPNDEVFNQIQQAFDSGNTTASSIVPASFAKVEAIKKELRLKSKYYLNSITPKSNGFLISGYGVAGVEKPIYLTNPTRVVFDIPNSIVNTGVINKEFKSGTDSIKISQFDSKRVRLVITSNQLEKYFPIFSSDGQSILFINSENFDSASLFNKTTDAVSYQVTRVNPNTEQFVIGFNSPVVHSIRRDNSNLTINFYNALRYNDKNFRNAVNDTGLQEMKIDLLSKVGLKLTLPLENNYVVNTYLGSDGRTIKLLVKGVKARQEIAKSIESQQIICLPKVHGKKSVVLDAGHGGTDYGAIRAGINEKDINLDVTKRVQAILQSKGVATCMTRESDEFVSLEDRTKITTSRCPDIFVSLHVNSAGSSSATGLETHYYRPDSFELAQVVHSCLTATIKSPDRGLKKSRFYVIKNTTVPAILVEIGFISNDQERAELVSEQRKEETAKAIAEGVLRYLNKK